MYGESKGLRMGMLVVLAAFALAVPSAASATTTLWVSGSTPSAPFNSCEHPGYDHIQEALGGPGTAIHVCAGTYPEQVTIERAIAITGYGGATLKLPAVTQTSSSPCDVVSEEASKLPDQDAISICGMHKVSITGLQINAVWPGEPVGNSVSCAYNLNGILVAGGANLELDNSTVVGARPHVINGCQYGVGVQIGMSYTPTLGVGVAELSGDTIDGYDKNGITVEGGESHATIAKTTVTGDGPLEATGQNGIGVQLGAKATITGSTISRNECENATCGEDALTDYQADGIYFYEAGTGSSLLKSRVFENDLGAEAYDSTLADPSISHDRFENNRWESVQISQGSATIDKDVMHGGAVGIQLLQYAGQAYGPTGTATHDTIESMSSWAVLGRSDKSSEDKPGELTITKSKISGNPGPRPLESVESENPTRLKIYAEKDH